MDLCDDPGTSITRSEIDARGTFGMGIFSGSGAQIRDSEIHSDQAPAILQDLGSGSGSRPYSIRRSWISSAADSSNYVLNLTSDVTLDSSLVTGGVVGARNDAFDDVELTINNSTIDAAQPGVSDVSDGAHALELSSSSPADVDASVDSSILVEDVNVLDGFDGTATVSCDYSDLPSTNVPAPWTDDCPLGGGSTNTSTPPGDLFVGGDPFDWSLKAGAPAIDTGTPGPPPPGFAVQDLAGNPRRAPGTNATCPDGVRDKGAYEFIGPPCVTQLPTIIGGENPTPGTQLSSTRGTWTDTPTGYSRQWLRCDAGGSDCTEVADRTGQSYTVRRPDLGHTLRIRVIATNGAGPSDPARSDPSGVVAEPPG